MDAQWRTIPLAIARRHSGLRVGNSAARGFTVVELITTILLLAILSSVAISRIVKPSVFAPGVFSHQLTLELNLAQGLATARQDTTVNMVVLRDSGSWLLRTSTNLEGVIRDTAIDAANSTLAVSNGTSTAALSNTVTLSFSFSGTGNISTALLNGLIIDPGLGIQFDFTGDSNRTLCLHPSGYLDANACS